MTDAPAETGQASTVHVTVDPGDSATLDAVSAPSFRRYLRQAHAGPVAIDTVWQESVDDGCGTLSPVELRVMAVTGGERVGEETTFEFDPV